MIAIDTNVIVRILVEDDRAQSEKAKNLLQQCEQSEEACFLSDIVICETIRILESCYDVSRKDIVATLSKLISSRQLAFESADRIASAMQHSHAAKETSPTT